MIRHLDIDQERLAAYCRKWHIVELSVFGSVLRDDFTDDSDVDFLVKFAEDATITLFDLVHMNDEMAALTERSVDIIDKLGVERSRNPYRRAAILSSYEILYAA